MQRKAEEFRKSPLVDSAVVTNEATVLVYFRRDMSSPYRVTEFTQPRLKPAAEQRPKQRILSEVVPLLQAGGMLVLDYRIELEVPATRVRQFREELAALRSGVRDPATTFIKNSEIVSRFSKPEVPLRSLIEVGH